MPWRISLVVVPLGPGFVTVTTPAEAAGTTDANCSSVSAMIEST